MNNWVGSEGPRTAKLAVVAEKPSWDERTQGRPLVGLTGKMLRNYLNRAGLDAGHIEYRKVKYQDGEILEPYMTFATNVYLTNAVKTVDYIGNPSEREIKNEQLALYRELEGLPNLNCILALGQIALIALSNFNYNDITHRRGSVIQSFIRRKMVPTFHTSYIQRGNWEMGPVVQFDINRAVAQSQFPEIRRKER